MKKLSKSKIQAKEAKLALSKWIVAVKDRDGERCACCGELNHSRISKNGRKIGHNVHHIIPRQIKQLKTTLENGILLCVKCHKYSNLLSAHRNPVLFTIWLQVHRPEQLKILLEKYNKIKDV